MKVLEIGLKSSKYLYKFESVWAKVGLGPLRVSNAIFPYLMLFSGTFSRFVKGTLGSILWAQTPSNWPHHGRSFCQAWPKEYFILWGGWDRGRQARATVSNACWKSCILHCTVALACRLRSLPPQRPKYSLGHAWQKLLPWCGQLEGVWAHRIDPKVLSRNLEINSRK